jgi:hypothetical protein
MMHEIVYSDIYVYARVQVCSDNFCVEYKVTRWQLWELRELMNRFSYECETLYGGTLQ